MAKFIKTTLKMRQELMKQFGLSITGIKNALAYKSFSERAERIRQAALAAGGEVMESALWPECRTQHTNTQIIQTFANGVVLTISKVDSSAELTRGGKVCRRFKGVTIDKWSVLVKLASQMARVR